MTNLRAKELIIGDLQRNQVSIACLQECRWDVEEIGSKCGEYKLWGGGAWKNQAGARQGGVAIAIHKSLWQCVERFQLISGRVLIMSLKGQLGKQLVVCSAYSPIESDTDSCKDMFWNDVQKAMLDLAAKTLPYAIFSFYVVTSMANFHHLVHLYCQLVFHILSDVGVEVMPTLMVCDYWKRQRTLSYVLLDHCFGDPSNKGGLFLAPSMSSTPVRDANMITFLFHFIRRLLCRVLKYYAPFCTTLIIAQ